MSSDVAHPISPTSTSQGLGVDGGAVDPEAATRVGDDISLAVPQWADPVIAGVLAAATTFAIGADWLLVAFAPWALILGLIAAIDFRELRVPNRLLRAGFVTAVPTGAIGLSLTNLEVSLTRGIWAALAGLGLFGLCHLASPRSLGMGDVKLAPYIGLHLGIFSWDLWYRGLLFGFVLVSIAGVIAMVAARIGRRACLPFAPFMAAGAVVALLWG